MDMSKLVRDMRDSAYVVAPFDEGLEILSNAGYSLVSPKDLADLRIREGRYSNVSMKESWTTFGVLYVPNKGKYLTKNSPIMMDPKGTTEAHKNRKDFYPTPEQIERGLADAVEIESGEIPAEIFGEHPVTVYAFGDSAQKYGDFLRRIKILKVPVWLADMQDKSFVRQLRICGLVGDVNSGFGCNGRAFGFDRRLRGIRKRR